ncbi:chemotaxis protein CheB [Nibrella saemangeumensis]|uniref:protein-glutamate methylesterase n=1 Tax=Nibrella saemangeumensis TaxID=1084526 RepID=A0ABP8NQE1_9BACT
MVNEPDLEIIVIGGSAGSISVMIQILSALPLQFPLSIVIVLHRLKNVSSEMNKILSMGRRGLNIHEPDDKEPVQPGTIYLAPQNYHLLVEADKSFGLDYSELVNYSRPAIDVTFESVAQVFGPKAVGVLLSGANHDGAAGLQAIVEQGGRGIVQDPETAEYPTMPRAALAKTQRVDIFTPQQIVTYLESLCC